MQQEMGSTGAARGKTESTGTAKTPAASKPSTASELPVASKTPVPSKSPVAFLMVCLGNICRSPLAEGILEQKVRAAGLDWKVDSAGTNGYHIGEAPHPLSQKVARMKGIDLSGQRARKFTADDFRRYDKIYSMAGDVVHEMRRIAGRQFDPSKVALLMNEVTPGGNQDVPDPWSGPESGYHTVYRMIEEAADRIIQRYTPAISDTAQQGAQKKN